MISSVPVSIRGLFAVDLELRLSISTANSFNDHARAGASSGDEILTMLTEEEEELQEWQSKLNIAEKKLEEMKDDYKVLYKRRHSIGFDHDVDMFIKSNVVPIEHIRRYLCLSNCTPEMHKEALVRLSNRRRALNKLAYLKSMGYTTYMAKRDYFMDLFRSFNNKQG